MALSAKEFMSGAPADHLDADAFMSGTEPTKKKTSLIDDIADTYNESVDRQGGYGLTAENKKELGMFGADYGPLDVGARALTGLQAGAETLAHGADYIARETGLSKLPQALGLDVLANNKGGEFLPGSAAMAVQEALPALGAEAGMMPHVPRRFSAATEQGIQDLYKHGNADEIVQAVREAGGDIDPQGVAEAVAKRDAGAQFDPSVRYGDQTQLPMEEQRNLPFDKATPEQALSKEAEAFMQGKPVEDIPDYRQRDLPLDKPMQQLGLDLPEPAAKLPEEIQGVPQETPKNVQAVVDHANETVGNWKNAPGVEVHPDFSKVADLDDNALGVYNSETGTIRLNTKAIEEEAAYRGLSTEQMTNTVLFHEGLGHFGLDQHFRTGLDSTLKTFYKESPEFKASVNKWMKENPDAYHEDLDPVARAAEEVLAEASEGGAIPLTLKNRLKNFIKGNARKMGVKLNYSDREIKTILAQAHQKVVKGASAGDGSFVGDRYMRPERNDQFTPDMDVDQAKVAYQYGYGPEEFHRARNEVDFRYAVDQERRRRLGQDHDNILVETKQDDIDWVEKTRARNAAIEGRAPNKYMKTYHGSPEDFDEFDHKKIGTGEGASVFGHGTYLADKKEVAELYRDRLTKGDIKAEIDGQELRDKSAIETTLGNRFHDEGKTKAAALVRPAIKKAAETGKLPSVAEILESARIPRSDVWDKAAFDVKAALRDANLEATPKKGKLYEVDLPDNSQFVEWEKTVGQQPALWQALKDNGFDIKPDRTGEEVYKFLTEKLGSKEAASQALHDAGFAGTRYKDQLSREGKAGSPSYNYVIYDDKTPTITNKYMMKRSVGPGSEGPSRGHMNEKVEPEEGMPAEPVERGTLANYRSNRNVSDILKENEAERTKETWEDWIDKAGRTKMTGKMAEGLEKGIEVPELKAAEKFLLESTNRVFDLSRKAVDGTLSPRDNYILAKELERNKKISEAIYGVVSNAGRILNSRKIEVASDRALNDAIRNMMNRTSAEMLNDPAAIEQLAQTLLKSHDKGKRMGELMQGVNNSVNLPRTIMSSYDLSAPFRQGLFLVHRKQFWTSFSSMFKAFGSEKGFNAVQDSIENSNLYPLMQETGLALADLGHDLTKREEAFMSEWGNKIPGVRRSERAYTAFLNKVRADTFSDLVIKAQQADPQGVGLTTKGLKDLAGFVNNATGRGELGRFTQAGPLLNGLFFSPRLIASRVNLLNPAYYVKLDPFVRKEAVKSLLSLGAIATTVAALAKAGGADVETDARSSDFAKIKTGNTRYDILGGFGQYLTLGARLATNEKKKSNGNVVELGKKYGDDTRLDVATNFGINKFSPVASFITDYLRGKDPVGEKFEVKKEVASRFVPLFLQDANDVIQEHGAAKGIPMSIPGIFGVGIQTYTPRTKTATTQPEPSTVSAGEFMKGQTVQ